MDNQHLRKEDMSKKITQEEFERRFSNINKDRKFTIIEYTAISNPCVIRCDKCNKIHHYNSGNSALSKLFCCEQIDRIKSIKDRLTDEYQFIKQVDKDNIIIKHLPCGNEQKRAIQSAFKEPCSCKICNGSSIRTRISIPEYQQRLDEQFGYIKVLEYNGQLEKNTYKCLKCGLIFKRDAISQKASRGCPKCDKKSNLS